MILAIDIGNMNIAVGCISDTGILFKERIYTDVHKTAVEYAISFASIFEIHGVKISEVDGGILSSSVPPVTGAVKQAAEKMLGKKVLEVGPGVKTGLDIKIDNPAQLGPDLAVGAVAGIEEYGAPLVIVDMATASTIMVVNEKRQVIGGMIMPGVAVSLEGMSQRTAYLPKISIEQPRRLIGRSTVECMKSGILYGSAACIDGAVERIFDELGYRTKVVATGGLSKKIIPYCRQEIILDDELALKGLKIIYDKNVRG